MTALLKRMYNLIFLIFKIASDNFSPIIRRTVSIPAYHWFANIMDLSRIIISGQWLYCSTVFLFTSGACNSHKSRGSLRRRRMTQRVMAKILSGRESATVAATMTPKGRGEIAIAYVVILLTIIVAPRRDSFLLSSSFWPLPRERDSGRKGGGGERGKKRRKRKREAGNAAAAVPQQQYPRVEWGP